MSLTNIKTINKFVPVYTNTIHKVSSTSADTLNMKYVFKSYTGDSTTWGLVSTNLVFPGRSTYGEFNPNSILKSYINFDYNPFGTGTTFVNNAPNSILKYKIEYGEQIPISGSQYSFSSITSNGLYTQYNFNSNPGFAVGNLIKINKADSIYNSEYNGWQTITSISATTGIVTNKLFGVQYTNESGDTVNWQSINSGITFSGYCLNFGLKHLEGGVTNTNIASVYGLKDVNSKYLTNRDNYYLYTDQSYSLSVLNTGSTQPFYLMVKGFSGGSQQTLFQYPLSIPASTIRYDVNIGFPNLSRINYIEGFTLTVKPLVHDGLDYYTVDLTTAGVSQLIERKTIYVKKSCANRYTRYILAYLNPRGGFDNLYFNYQSKSKIKIDRENIYTAYQDNYSLSDFGEKTLNSNIDEIITVTSDYLNTDSEINLYVELINSPVAYLQDEENQRLIPIQITTKELQPLKRQNSELYYVNIDFKLAYKDDNITN